MFTFDECKYTHIQNNNNRVIINVLYKIASLCYTKSMKTLKTVITNKLYSYDKDKFMPVYIDGQPNMKAFWKYKATETFLRFSDRFDNFREWVN